MDYFHIPGAVSFPHFLMGADKYIHGVIGLSPNQQEHETTVDIEPVSDQKNISLMCEPRQHYCALLSSLSDEGAFSSPKMLLDCLNLNPACFLRLVDTPPLSITVLFLPLSFLLSSTMSLNCC